MRVRIDLHSHSNVSDGTTSPTEVVERAAELGLDVLALTDHDTDAGWDEAASAARRTGICLVPGMEISTKHRDRGVHVLGYLLDPEFPPLASSSAGSWKDGTAGWTRCWRGSLPPGSTSPRRRYGDKRVSTA